MQRLLRLVHFLLYCSPALAIADGKAPDNIFGVYQRTIPVCVYQGTAKGMVCDGVAEDRITLERQSEGAIRVQISLRFDNGHDCAMDALGVWEDDHVLVETTDKSLPEVECALEVYSDGNEVTLEDPTLGCARMWCGARGILDKTKIKRKAR